MKAANKGQIRIIEAFFAMLIVFSAFAVSANLTITRNSVNRADLESIGLGSLIKLDQEGVLSYYLDQRNFSTLREALNLVLPTGVLFNLTVYDRNLKLINELAITNGGFSSEEVVSVEYLCASQDAVYRCYIIHLQLAIT